MIAGEDLRLKVIVVSAERPRDLAVHWRRLGKGEFSAIALAHVARGVCTASIPARQMKGDDIEYYVQASIGAGTVRFPVTAPATSQTVVIVPQD